MKRPFVLALVFATALPGAALLVPVPAQAQPVFLVNSVLDQIDDDINDGVCHTAANTCTLRAAIMQANRATGVGATIVLPAGNYVLTRPQAGSDDDTSSDLNLATPISGAPLITIAGAGASMTIIDANQIDGVLRVEPQRTAVISGVTIQGGYGSAHDGGGIDNEGALTIDHVRVTQNHAALLGGGIYNASSLVVRDSTIDFNTAPGPGGGLFNEATADIRRSLFAFDTADYGGGIDNYRVMTIVDSTITGNEALSNAGGIYAVENSDAVTNVYSSTSAYNDADRDRQGAGSGGGVYIDSYNGGTFNIRNTLLAGNTVGNTPIYDDCTVASGATLYSYGSNLFGTSDGCLIDTVTGTWANFSGNLGGLADNGGPTQTVALLSGYNAIDGGDPAGGCVDDSGNPIATDQRGFARNVGSCCDIGAYEFDADRISINGFG